MSNSQTYKILVISPGWIGDLVMAQGLFRHLQQQHQALQLDVLAPPWAKSLLARMPEVHQMIESALVHGKFDLKERLRLGRLCRAEGYDQAIVLPNSFKSALIPFFSGIKKRTGWLGEQRWGLLNDVRRGRKTRYEMTIEQYIALGFSDSEKPAKPYLLPKIIANQEKLSALALEFGVNLSEKPIIALCPGAAFGSSKQWPAEYFSELACQMLEKGWQVWIFGGPNDRAVAGMIQQMSANRCHDFVGKTNLGQAIDLLAQAKVVVSNDSGLMHISAALSRSLVAVYGSTSADRTPPLGDKVKILNLHLSCSPCFKRECPLGHHRCMLDLKPSMVLAAIGELVV